MENLHPDVISIDFKIRERETTWTFLQKLNLTLPNPLLKETINAERLPYVSGPLLHYPRIRAICRRRLIICEPAGTRSRTVTWNICHRLPQPISTCMARIIWTYWLPKSGKGSCAPYGQCLRCSKEA